MPYGKFSPIAKLVEQKKWPPYPLESEKWYKFLDEQKEIFEKGYEVEGERITGRHYYFLNFCHIGVANKHGAKVPTLPFISDSQKEFFDTFEDICKTGENMIVLKGRDKGHTYSVASLTLFNMMNEDFSEVMVLFPGGTSTAKANFRKAYDMAYNELIFDLKHPSIKSTEGKYVEEIKYAVEITETDPRTGKPTSIKKIIGPQTKLTNIVVTDPSVVRSGRQQLIIVEEMGEMGGNDWGSKDLIGVAQANLKEGSLKLGPLIAGGTSNQFKDGFGDFRDLWYDPGQYNFRKLWIPGNKSYWGFVNYNTGESDFEGAKGDILEIRKTKKGKDLLIHKQEWPLTEDEAFFQGINSVFDVTKCNKQIARIKSDPSIKSSIQRGNLYPKKEAGGIIKPVWEIEPNGKFQIFKHPDASLQHKVVLGLDSYRLGKVSESPSKGAIEAYVPFQGMNTPGDYPAMIYWERPEDKEVFFMDALLATMYYDTQILVELTDEDIIAFFKTHNALKYLKERPNITKSMYSKAENKYGILPTIQNKSMALEHSIKLFNVNYDQIVFVELLDEMIRYAPEVNTDRVDAHNWAVLHGIDNMKVLEEYKKPVRTRRFSPFTAVDARGNLVVVDNMDQASNMGLMENSNTILSSHERMKRYESKFK